jgi:hypothetical protein
VSLPAGRRYHVATWITGPLLRRGVKLAQYVFHEDGTCEQQYWAWRFRTAASSDVSKPRTGYRTEGCQADCMIRTPRGFQPGSRAPGVRAGSWTNVPGGFLVTWSDGGREAWATRDDWSDAVSLHVLNPASSTPPSWALGPFWFGALFGSNCPPDVGATPEQVRTAGPLLCTNWHYDMYDANQSGAAPLVGPVGRVLADWDRYDLCSRAGVMALHNTNFHAGADDASQDSWYHSYWVFDPVRNGRKAFWNHQTGRVANRELTETALCLSPHGGHAVALLQIMGDNGEFEGVVFAEESVVHLARGAYLASGVLRARPADAVATLPRLDARDLALAPTHEDAVGTEPSEGG